MDFDPYKYSAPLYDFFAGRLSVFLDRTRMRLAPPLQGMNVLDVGCGTGSDLKLYHQAGCRVHGVDLSPAMLKVARRKLGKSADLRLCDAADMPYEDDFFDLVLATYTLHEMHYEHRPVVIREMTRVLKRDGRLLLIDFLPGPFSFPGGWMIRSLILLLEIMSGREHLNNGRDFLRRGGLLGLINHAQMNIESTISLGAGNIGFFLVSTY
jgi:ubiquinone/menaquinone biosynthesis C-methylase UbiE